MKTEKLRAYTAEEVRSVFLSHMLELCKYWSHPSRRTTINGTECERMEGLCHSILAMIDGSTLDLPAIDLVLCPHKEDKQYHISEGENWFKKGMIINDCTMASQLYVEKRKNEGTKCT